MTIDKQRTALYRAYSSTGELMYVGISLSVMSRLSQHKNSSAWFNSAARIDIEYYPTRTDALAAEKQAIQTECPVHNKAGKVKDAVPSSIPCTLPGTGTLEDLIWECRVWDRLVTRYEEKARNSNSIIMALYHQKLAEQNAEKANLLWLRRKERKNSLNSRQRIHGIAA
tara:strand:+ start:774 stop:1280 length:507 start_codon:yes stop_codon:yes gene_type:complete